MRLKLRVARTVWPLALALVACGASRRAPRPTILNAPPPQPPPESNEVRLMPVALRPDVGEPLETAPGTALASMARRALDAEQPALVRCYEELLVHRPAAAGRVEVQLDLNGAGAITRVHLDHAGDGVAAMLPCLRDAFSAARVRGVEPDGQYVSRVYTFTNPPIDRATRTAVVISAPPRPPRAPRRRGAVAPPPPAVEPAPSAPRVGPGSLRVEELRRGVTESVALRACATIALRGLAGAAVDGSLRMTVGADGAASEATFTVGMRAPQTLTACVVDAALAMRFRASGIVVRTEVPLTFRR